MKKLFNYKTILSLGLLLIPAVIFASTGTTNTPINNPVTAPLDGGLSLLAAAGIGYGIKKFAANKKKRQSSAAN